VKEEDPALEALTRAGLTPAQAYQQQVYLSSPMAQQQNPQQANSTSRYSPQPSIGSQRSQNGSASHLPKFSLDLDNGGELGLDFGIMSSPETDPGSELPWASPSSMFRGVFSSSSCTNKLFSL
jgi:hypothetical protein